MAIAKSGTKRSLFKKPTWASTSPTTTTDDDAPIFGQSHHYQEILQNERERRDRHAAKQKERAEQEKAKQVAQEREIKRRRISNEAEDSDHCSGSDSRSIRSGSVNSRQSQKSATPVQEASSRALRSMPKKGKGRGPQADEASSVPSPQKESRRVQNELKEGAIVLDPEDNSSIHEDLAAVPAAKATKSKPKPKQRDMDPESEEEDEYLRELKARARQEARSKRLGIGVNRADTPNSPSKPEPSNSQSLVAKYHSPDSNRATFTPTVEDEAEVEIFITTLIPNASEVIVNRKINQPLEQVREYWIRRNQVSPAIASEVFFTWKNTRLYNSSTMRGIIERLKKTNPRSDGGDPSNGKIMIEAVTEKIFAYRLEQKARQQAEDAAAAENALLNQGQNPDTSNGSATINSNETPAPSQPPCVVIKLKAQDFEDLPMRVRFNSTMGKIVYAFCKLNKIDEDAYERIWLNYDGDKLDKTATVQDVGFEDEDTVEVHFKLKS